MPYNEADRRAAEKYADLPDATRRWLESLREDDVTDLKEAQKLYRRLQAITWFWKWVFLTALAVFAAATQLGEHIVSIISWLKK